MSLLDDLRAIGEKIPPSHLPTAQELLKLAGATLLYLEHGQAFVDQLKKDDATLDQALAPAAADQVSGAPVAAPAVADPTPAPAAPVHAQAVQAPESVDDQLAMLHKQQEQIATAIAALQRGTVETTGENA